MSTANWREGVLAPAEDDIVSCVACGLCLPHCPTFRVTGRETAAPRGRIAAMRAVQEGHAEVDDAFAKMMDECLACRACETACPSGVPFGRMVEAARAQIEPTRPAPERLARRVGVVGILSRPWAVWLMGAGLGATQALKLDRLLPARLRSTSPRVSLRELVRPLPRSVGQGPTATLVTGCVMNVAFRPVHRATMKAVAGAGFRATRTHKSGCCGALAMHYGHPEAAKKMARERIAELEGADVVVINSAGCGGHMKTWGHLLADDPDWADRAERVAAKVRDVLELELAPRARQIGPVAVHDACHHVNGQGIKAQSRQILRTAGATPVEVVDDGRCCGAAGLYSVLQPEMSAELRRQKAHAVVASGAPYVSVANPGCAIQIAAGLKEIGSDIRVVHPTQLMD